MEEEEEQEFSYMRDESIRHEVAKDLEALSALAELSIPKYQGWTQPLEAKNHRSLELNSLSVNIPEGRLFHPSCGEDAKSWELFSDAVAGFDFADPYKIKINKEWPRDYSDFGSPYKRRVATNQSHVGNMGAINLPNNLLEIDTPSSSSFVRRFFLDGIVTMVGYIQSISVFYCTGDSQGESGSGQNWLGPSVFPLVLDKLFDGGLIVIDNMLASQAALYGKRQDYGKLVPWDSLIGWEDAEKRESFLFAGREFKRLGSVGKKNGPIVVWQVTTL